jgi:hypothetical protein
LYIFAGDHLLCVRLRQANIDAAAGSLAEVERIVGQIRARWPETRIILRGDSGFCRDELMDWCERQRKVDFVFGMARNERRRKIIADTLAEAGILYCQTLRPARVFAEFQHSTTTGSWSRPRRVIAKAEHILSLAATAGSDRRPRAVRADETKPAPDLAAPLDLVFTSGERLRISRGADAAILQLVLAAIRA